MEKYIAPPDALVKSENMVANWSKWKKDFLHFMNANDNMRKTENIKIDMLKHHIGIFGRNVIETLASSEITPEANNLHALLLQLDKYFNPPINLVLERYNFFSSAKDCKESIEAYIDNLKEKAKRCQFGKLQNSLIRDKIIAELKDKELINKLIQKENLDLLSLISIYKDHSVLMQTKKSNRPFNNTNNRQPETQKNDNSNYIPGGRNCRRCNKKHAIRQCPAWGVKCLNCGQSHHYTHCCEFFHLRTEKQKPNPTAPPFSDIENTLYPAMNHMKTLQSNMNTSAWTWLGYQTTENTPFQQNIAHEQFQQTAAHEQWQQTAMRGQCQQTTAREQLQQTAACEQLQQTAACEQLQQTAACEQLQQTSKQATESEEKTETKVNTKFYVKKGKIKHPMNNSKFDECKTTNEGCSIT